MADAIVALPHVPPEVPPPRRARLTEASLGRLLGALASRSGPVPKYRYPSAGTLYPVQTHVVLRRALGGIPAGTYYHHPDHHALVMLSDDTPAAPDGSMPDGMLLLVAQQAAIEPIYHEQTAGFCLLEAGYMFTALQSEADGLALRECGDPTHRRDLAEACRLDASHVPLICWAIGEIG